MSSPRDRRADTSGATSRAVRSVRSRSSSAEMIRRTRATSRRRRSIELSAKALRSSMSRRVTPGTSATAGSTSRGTAMSTMSSSRPKRRCMASSISSWLMTISVEPVEVSTRSADTSAWGSCSIGIARPPTRMASSVERSVPRPATTTSATPEPARERAMPSPISPAPRTRTRRSTSVPSRSAARATAADDSDTAPRPMPVSARDRFPTSMAKRKIRARLCWAVPSSSALFRASRTWPRIWPSPRITESTPAATPKRWATAASS